MRLKMLLAVLCLSMGISVGVSASAFARPQMQTVNILKSDSQVSDVSARRRHKVKAERKVKRAKKYRAARRQVQAYAPECYGIMPCIGVETSYQWSGGRNAAPVRVTHNRQSYKQRLARTRYSYNSLGAPEISVGYSANRLVNIARSYMGTNPTGWSRVWCGRFMAMIAPEAARRVRNPNWARDWVEAGYNSRNCQVGSIAVLSRGRGGHVGVVSGCTAYGPQIVSGNHGRRVGEGVYSERRVLAYVVPR